MRKAIFIALIVSVFLISCSQKNYDTFVECLNGKDVKFYGAFWCPHCQNQKKIFGSSANNLPYIECSTEDGKAQTEVCQQALIKSYPTWEFPDGTRLTGEIALEDISRISGCELQNG